MKFTFYGHSCFRLETGGSQLVFDPFVSPNPLASEIDVDQIPADLILVSHGHEDHVADVERIARNTGAKIMAGYEVASWFGAKGLDIMPMNHGGSWHVDAGRIQFVNAVHSSVLPDGTCGGNPGGFVISNASGCVYYAGDTALTMDMQLIGKTYDVDVCVLPIGDVFTMGIDDAITAAEFVGCNTVIGMHFDTFPPIAIDKEKAKQAFADAGKELILLDIGSSWER